MKKKALRGFSLIIAVLLVMVTSIVVNVSAVGETKTNGEYEYVILDGGVIQLLRYQGKDEIVNIPEEIDGKLVTHVWDRCFLAQKIREIHIPKTLVNLYTSPADTFFNENLEAIYVDEENPVLASKDGILFNKDYTTLGYYPTAKKGDSYEIPDTVDTIDQMSFYGNKYLKKLVVNSNVKHIESFSLQNMKSLEEVEYSVDEVLDRSVFQQCENLKKVYIGENVKHLNDYDFSPNAVFYVYKNSYGESFAIANNYDYVIISKYENTTLIDPKTKLKVSGNIDTESVLKVEYNNIDYKLNARLEYIKGFNITLVKDGIEVQPNGKITICIPYSGKNVDKIIVYRAENDGHFTDMQAKYEDGYFIFETEHLSDYLLFKKLYVLDQPTESSKEPLNTPNEQSMVVSKLQEESSNIISAENSSIEKDASVDVPKTGDNGIALVAICAIICSFTCCIFLCTRRREKIRVSKK